MTDVSAVDPGEPAPALARKEVARGRRLATLIQGQGLLAMALLICVYFGLSSPFFFTTGNVLIIGATAAPLGIMALAQTFLILSGGIDVSVGSVVAISTVTAGLLMQAGLDFWPAAGAAIALGAGVGGINAILVVALGINPIISTLGTLSVFQGLAFAITGGRTIVVDDPTLAYIGIGTVRSAGALHRVPHRVRRRGRLRAVHAMGPHDLCDRRQRRGGAAVRAAREVHAGRAVHPVGTVRWRGRSAHPRPALRGQPAGRCHIPPVSRDRRHPRRREPSGGKGTVVGTIVAVAILGMLNNGFALLGSSSAAQQMALGVALIFAVLLELVGRRLRRGGSDRKER